MSTTCVNISFFFFPKTNVTRKTWEKLNINFLKNRCWVVVGSFIIIFWRQKPLSSLTLPFWLLLSLEIPRFHTCGFKTPSLLTLQPLAVPLRLFIYTSSLPLAPPLSFSSPVHSHLSISTPFVITMYFLVVITTYNTISDPITNKENLIKTLFDA